MLSASCRERPLAPLDEREGEASLSPPLFLFVSSADAGPGDSIVFALGARANSLLGGVQGRFEWDPRRLRYLGSAPGSGTLLVLNSREIPLGRPRFVAVDPHGLDSMPALLGFEVLRPDYAAAVAVDLEQIVGLDLVRHPATRLRPQVRLGLLEARDVRQYASDEG